ncbi:hypothetical protein J1614_010735 [Plenodomus biglobosus]|nr:hypothetical protein J1614_010735 [Plenodomus biglobosus]
MPSQETIILTFLQDVVRALRFPDWEAKILEQWHLAPRRSPTPDERSLTDDREHGEIRDDAVEGKSAASREGSQELMSLRTYGT